MNNQYEQQAEQFLKEVNAKYTITFKEFGKHFQDDKYSRNIYRVKLYRNGKSYSFNYGDSVNNTRLRLKPNIYDVLSCLIKYDVGSFDNFCSEFGYDTDSRKAEKIYKLVCKEFEGVERVFSDVMDKLQKIQ